jgi:DNA-binding HxlR family transcriptional regulator
MTLTGQETARRRTFAIISHPPRAGFRGGGVTRACCHIIVTLANGPMRTAEIRRGVEGVSEKMLIQTLRKLEGFGLVSRKSYPEVPPRVDYRLTPLGRSLARLAGMFSRWVERNSASLIKAEQDAA